jgi:V8-like Glu-specific endopeptidase
VSICILWILDCEARISGQFHEFKWFKLSVASCIQFFWSRLTMNPHNSVSKPSVTMAAFEMAEAEVTEVLQSEGSAGQVPPEYGVSAKRLLVRGKGDLEKPTRSSLSIVNPSVLTPESVIGTDDRIRVLDPETMPWRMICSLEISGRTGKGIGTGWFVGPKTIITAGHCVYHPNFGGWANEIKIYPGRYGTNFPFPQKPDFQKPIVSSKFDSVEGG